MSVPCTIVITCLERADLLVLLCGVFLWFCTFLYGVSGQVWYLVVSLPDLCLLPFLYILTEEAKTYCWGKESQLLNFDCLMSVCVLCFTLMAPWLNLQTVIMACSGQSYLLFVRSQLLEKSGSNIKAF